MNKKILISLIIIFILISLIIVLFFYNDKDRPDTESLDYYGELAKECGQKRNYDCCISSVKIMVEKNYKLVPETGCPEGYLMNTLRCVGSFQWCEKEIIEETIDEAAE